MLKILFIAVVALHGLIHLMGAAKAFGWVDVAALQHPISKLGGVSWLAASVLLVATAVLLAVGVHGWWLVAAPALILSQALIFSAWSDARFGTIANVIILIPVALALFDLRPSSLRSQYEAKVAAVLDRADANASANVIVTERDLTALPPPVQRYLRNAGVVGKPRVDNVRVRWKGAIRNGADASWMPFVAEQYNTFGEDKARLFFIDSRMFGVPFDGLHAYEGAHATMKVRIASLFNVVDAAGPEMDQGETVTMFADICSFAPAALIDPSIRWQPIDDTRARGTFSNAGHTVTAELVFDERGDMIDFRSDDRFQTTDGKVYRNIPWSTPMRSYRTFNGVRLASEGDARWLAPEGELVYGRFELLDIEYNVTADEPSAHAARAPAQQSVPATGGAH